MRLHPGDPYLGVFHRAQGLNVCFYQVSQVVLQREFRDTLEESIQDRRGDQEVIQDFEDKSQEFKYVVVGNEGNP